MICHLFQKLEYQSLFNFKKIIKDFKFSLSFLSILPCGKIDKPIPTIDEACWAFPICGLIIGSIVFISFYIANYFNLPIYLCSIIAILSGIFVLLISKAEQSKYFSSFWVEGIPILWLVLRHNLI